MNKSAIPCKAIPVHVAGTSEGCISFHPHPERHLEHGGEGGGGQRNFSVKFAWNHTFTISYHQDLHRVYRLQGLGYLFMITLRS